MDQQTLPVSGQSALFVNGLLLTASNTGSLLWIKISSKEIWNEIATIGDTIS